MSYVKIYELKYLKNALLHFATFVVCYCTCLNITYRISSMPILGQLILKITIKSVLNRITGKI